MGLSPVHDYIHRPRELANVSLYDWIQCYKREKMPQRKCMQNNDALDENINTSFLVNASSNVSFATDNSINLDVTSEYGEEKKSTGRTSGLLRFLPGHPLYESHGVRYIVRNDTCVPDFVGVNLPRCDQGDREYYCCTMLVLFKPWRKGTNLKTADKLWDEEFQQHLFSEKEKRYMRNFNVQYECLDARDDYRSQMKKLGDVIIGSWDEDTVKEVVNGFRCCPSWRFNLSFHVQHQRQM